MLFKTKEGIYVEILRKQFINDTDYYTALKERVCAPLKPL